MDINRSESFPACVVFLFADAVTVFDCVLASIFMDRFTTIATAMTERAYRILFEPNAYDLIIEDEDVDNDLIHPDYPTQAYFQLPAHRAINRRVLHNTPVIF